MFIRIDVMKKQCSKCKETKPIEDFSPDGKGKWKYSCKKCNAKYVSERLKIKKAEDAAIEAAKFTYPRIPDHMKQCKYCLEIKVKDGNYRRRDDCAGGFATKCNACFNKDRPSRAGSEYSKKHWKKYYEKNREKLLKKQKENESRKIKEAERYERDKERMREVGRAYSKSPRGRALHARNQSVRNRRLKQAQPKWLTQGQMEEMANLYWLAQDLKAVTGMMYHVDHIVPLRGKSVCGLHVPWNLQVLPADVNIRKSNKMEI